MIIPGVKSDLPKLLYLLVGAALLIVPSSTLLINVYGQIFPNAQHPDFPSTSITSHQQSEPNLHLVKIISPTKGQQIRVGENMPISGTSVDNTTSDCKVMVIVNDIKPYRTVFPNGEGGDYSSWNYTLTSAYTSIKQGQNKITAKFICTYDPNLMSHSSVNVTGVGASLTPTANQKERQYAGMNSTTTSVNTTSGGNATSPSVANTNSNANNSMNNNGTMSVSIHLGKRTAQPGDKQSLIIKVTDLNSTTPVVGASLLGRIIDSSGVLFKKLEGTTDDTGKSSYSWTVSQDDRNGKYKTIIDVSAYGYKNSTASKSFEVRPILIATTTGSNNHYLTSMNDNNIIEPNELAQRIINQVKQNLEGNGIPLP